jgi:predicted transcriptional regulator
MKKKKKNKDVEIKARVTRQMRNEVESLAAQRGEATSLILREAIAEYLAKRALQRNQKHLR